MLKILADECIHTDLVKALSDNGLDVVTVSQLGLSGKSDEVIFKQAIKSKRILLTFDRGFGDIFRFNISSGQGIVIILPSQMTKEELIALPLAFFKSYQKGKLTGKLVIIGKTRIRISERTA